MVATTQPRRQAAARPARQAQPRRADLRIVRPDHRVAVVGTLGSAVAITIFVVLFVIAGLHAVLVQTQAQIDAQRAANAQVKRNSMTWSRLRGSTPQSGGGAHVGVDRAQGGQPHPDRPGALPALSSANPAQTEERVTNRNRRPASLVAASSLAPPQPERLPSGSALGALFVLVMGGLLFRLADLQLTWTRPRPAAWQHPANPS